MTISAWQPIVEGAYAARAQDMAFTILSRYKNRQDILHLIHPPKTWSGLSLPFGDAGVALAMGYAHRVRPLEGWDTIGHMYLQYASQGLSHSILPSLFGGLSGLNFAALYLSLSGKRYNAAIQTLNVLLADCLDETISSFLGIGGVAVSQYDHISGVSGIGRYLLHAENASRLLSHTNRILDWLIERGLREGGSGFFTPPEKVSSREHTELPYLADGYINLGLAHGLPGPLALLSIAALQNVVRPKLQEAIRNLADWLVSQHIVDSYGINWPSFSVDREVQQKGSRTAWCYGAPGLVRSLYLAALALKDAELRTFSVNALLAIRNRPLNVRDIDSPTFCHGVAGLLQTVLRFANDTCHPNLEEFARSILRQLLEQFEEKAPLGFRNIERRGDSPVDSPGLLTGALAACVRSGPVLA